MSYACDICSSEMVSKSSGTFYFDKDVNICPTYWERLAKQQQQQMLSLLGSDDMAENAYGLFVQQRLQDSSGFTVCAQCSDLVAARDQQLTSLGLAALRSAGIGDRDQVLVVAGVAWQQLTGKWPSCFDVSVVRLRDRVVSVGKTSASPNTIGNKSWWQFWKRRCGLTIRGSER